MRYVVNWRCLAVVWILLAGGQAMAGPMTTGLELWLDAGQGVAETGGVVTSWTGQTPGGHVFTPPAAGREPVLVADALNGRPVISFDKSGTSDILSNTTFDLADDKTVFLVISPDQLPAGNNERFFGHYGNGQLRYQDGQAAGWFNASAVSPDTTGIATGQFAILTYRFNGNVEIGVNGRAPVEALASTPQFTTTSALSVGGAGDSGGYFSGDIAEVVIYDSALAAQSRSDVEWYLMQKWFGVKARPYQPTVQTAALYHLDETSGVLAADSSVNGIDLTASASPFGGVEGVAGIAAAAGPFSGSSSQLVRTLDASEAAAFDTDNFTIEAWAKNPNADNTYDHDGVLGYRVGSSRFQFGVMGTDQKLHLGINREDTTGYFSIDSGNLDWEDDTWYHIAVTYDSNTAAANDSIVTFYWTSLDQIPTAPVVVATLYNQPDINPLTAGGLLTLGGYELSNPRSFGGYLDEIRYTNAVLTRFGFPVPEPASVLLLGLGTLCLAAGGRRRRKAPAAITAH